jgi:CDP-6-deoxy-D-xylo-4-hexulose-3-dehydrase
MKYKFPLMKNNILKEDLKKVIQHLKKKDPFLTQKFNVKKFEKEWSKWLGVKYSVFVNSGSSANLLSMALLKLKYPKGGEVIVPPLTWVSDISSVIQNNFKPVFVDINLNNLGMNEEHIKKKVTKNTKAVFLSHIQGFNALSKNLIKFLRKKKIFLIEDVCESHGAKFLNKKLGTFGWTSNFSFYYAHHMSTIEGGMVCTNDKNAYLDLLQLRSHGMLREIKDHINYKEVLKKYKNLNTDFIFSFPSYNLRSTEINAIIGLNQLKRLNKNIVKRNYNFQFFLKNLDSEKYFTNFQLTGSSNYAFNVIVKPQYKKRITNLQKLLLKNRIEFRMGSAGGGNQLRQPYLKSYLRKNYFKKFPVTEHVHNYGMYIGNYPELTKKNILFICKVLNKI